MTKRIENIKCPDCELKFKSPLSLRKHLHKVHIWDYERSYLYFHPEITPPLCPVCGKKASFFKNKYTTYCSNSCSSKITQHDTLVIQKKIETNRIKYGVDWSAQKTKIYQKSKNTKLEKYGNENYNNPNKMKQTCLEKYGVDNYTKTEEYNIKTKETCLKKYGVEHFTKSQSYKDLFLDKEYVRNIQSKIQQTLLKNKTSKFSKEENQIYELLIKKFPNTKRQHNTQLYPFNCDFYIPDLDLYIEYQGTWHHGNEPFDKNNEKHLNVLQKWKNKLDSNPTGQFDRAIETWTFSDVLKRQVAKENNLNYIEFFNFEQFLDWYNKQ